MDRLRCRCIPSKQFCFCLESAVSGLNLAAKSSELLSQGGRSWPLELAAAEDSPELPLASAG